MFKFWRRIISLLLCFWLAWGNSGAIALSLPQPTKDFPVVEYLKYSVPPTKQALFLKKEVEIWGAFNNQFPSFVGKEIWQDPLDPNILIIVAHWNSYQQMQLIPKAEIKAVDQVFAAALGETYQLLEIREFKALSPNF